VGTTQSGACGVVERRVTGVGEIGEQAGVV